MSDGDDFDREAERERLREKYERDKAKREATEQMSELLLQGATMTNQHCPECHSPVFRYDGQEFCPTCQREITEEGELAGDAAAGEESAGEGPAADAATNGEAGASVDDVGESAAGQSDEAGAAPEANRQPADEGSRPTGRSAESGPGDGTGDEPAPDTGAAHPAESADEPPAETRPATTRDRRPARVDPPARREEPTGRRERAAEAGDLGEAEAALVREITTLTRRAEETRDVGRKRDLFAAAREAAETLRELRRL